LSRRLVESVGQQEVRQRGYVYQKNRTQSEKWIPTERAYGRYRVDVPGEPGQREVRVALGFCRDRMSALLKLQNAMNQAGVLDAAKLRERITSTTTFAQQAEWMIAEMKAGRILAASNVRISELLALRIEKHISNDRKTHSSGRKNNSPATSNLTPR
jgi:hypothetical protein